MRVVVDPHVYSVDAAKKAAYRLLDKFSAQISIDSAGIICELTFQANLANADREAAVAEFWKELLDQDLRARVAQETEAVRNAVLAVAFAPVSERRE